jgi:hypothetical protein
MPLNLSNEINYFKIQKCSTRLRTEKQNLQFSKYLVINM